MAPFSYLWNSSPTQTTANLLNVAGGTYTVIVFDANGCSAQFTYSVLNPLPLACNATVVPITCSGNNNGSITLNTSGGTSPYTYLWSNGNTTSTNSGLALGTYTVTVTDVSGCTNSCSYTVSQLPGLSVNLSATNVTCNGSSNGTIISSIGGGLAPFGYLWSNGSTTINLTNIGPGIYTLTVTDNNGCSGTASVSITQPSALSCICNASVINVSCFGGNNGSVTALPIGGLAPYSYVWSNGQTTQTIIGLTAGTYTVTITDANGCLKVGSVTITQPNQLFALMGCVQNVTCNGGSNGTACVNGFGGVAPYTYSWNTVPTTTTSLATGLMAGTYTGIVTDANGCTASAQITISQPQLGVSCSITNTNITCFGNTNGSASAAVNGGTAPYTYLWSNGKTTQTVINLATGVYTVSVTDNVGCSSTCSVTITQPSAIAALYTVVRPLCNGNTNGSIDVSVVGGTSPYTYGWSNGATTQDLNNIGAGNYVLTIIDSKGCVLNASIAVTQPAVLNCSITKTNVTCNGGSNGSATVTATGGTSPYIYLWSNGVSTANNAGVAAGLYTVTITDSKGCTKNCFVTITQPSKLVCNANVLNIATCNNNNGKAQAVASGGVAPYTYIWLTAPVQTTAIATGLSSGTYVVVISDSKGCSSSCSVTVPSSNALSCSVFGINVSCNGGNDGTATVTVNGGVAPYTYLWNTSTAATTSSINSVNAGTYTVIVTDANGCTTSCFIVITQPAPLTCVATSTSLNCDGSANGTATASVTGGTSPYAYLWSDGQTNITATGLSSGSYTVLITDSKGCTSQCATTIAVVSPLSCQTSVTNATCAGFPNGTATVTTSGGLAAFSYVWSTTPPQFGATATGLSAGLYTVTVTDANGCITTCDASITQPGNLSCIAANTMPVTCYAGNDGEAQVAVNGGTPGYTYLWNTTPLQTNSTATGLSGGTYIVIVTDNVGCTSSCDVLVVQPAVLACSISPINTTCGLNNGSATVNVTGGTSGYTYLWSNGQTNATISALATGNYTATVTDANGCTTSCNTGINASSTIILTINKTPTNCNSICTGTASVSGVAGGTSPYTYLWSNGVTSVSATGLCAGTYTVTVTDNIGCSGSFSFNINQLPSLIVNISNFSNVSCFGLADGSAQVVASGGSTPYLYLWSDGQTNALASNLSAGNYTVTVTDKKGCTGTAVVTITEPAQLIASETHIDVTCNGGSNGSIDVTLQGGSAPFSYSWSNGQTTQDINNVPANTYIVTITQSNGCSQTLSVQIAQPNALICGINSSSPSCNGNSNGTANVVVTGGTPGYTYLWSNGISGSTLSGLIAGTYTVTVNDANGCTTVCQTTITDPAVLMLTSGKADVKCKGGSDGVASVVASGGTSPYTYLWNNGQTTSSISGLAANSYTVTATDNNGCSASLVIIINEPSQLQLITTGSNPTCGNTNGSASASTAGGTPSYTYLWSNGQNGAIISSIGSGTYTVTVTDANGCTATSSVTIGLSSNLNLNIVPTSPLCYGSAGSAIANVTGGSGIYSYIWNSVPVQTNLIATGLNAGSYTVIVSDNAGCTVSGSVTITEPQLLECTTTATGAACNGGCNGTATVAATGGTSPYVYNWNTIPTQTTATATGLCAGTYTVIVTDANGCTTSCVVSITGSPLLTCSVFKSNATKCGLPTGKLKAIPLGGSSPYTYLWNTGTTTQVLNFLFGGTYTVTVTDKFGCTSSCEATLKAHGPVDCFVTSTDASCGACNGTASVLASGGGLAYTYKWSTGATTKAISGLCPNTYVVTVSDQYACTKTCVVIIVTNNNLSCSVTGVNVQCNGGSNATATVSAVGGTGIYTYLWTTGATTQTVTGLTAGTYTATVTSGNNCTSTCSIVITKPQPLICTITATDASCGVCNGTGIINVVGGTAPYTYLWSNGLTNNVATTLCAGSYSALITDANGCSSACSVVINSIGNISCTISGTNVSCNGLNNGTATVNASGATATSYLWSNGQTNQTATGLVAGAYTATVSAGPGCTSSCVVIITEPAAITCTTTSTLAFCGVCNGSASVSAISGNPPFTYLWNNGSTTTSLSGLCGGLYTITVTDATGCTSICNVSVGTSNPLSCIISRTNVSCNGGTNGSATVNPTGGAGYTYLWSNGSTTKTITGLGAGSYTVTVSANNGCTTSCNVTITQPAILSCATTSTPAKCGVCNGTATITATGGTIPYTYLWSTGSTTKTILALCSGVYTVSVTDKKGCTTTCTVSVGATTPISCSMTKKDISCNGGNDGTATVTAFGGTSYTYLWNNGQTTATATGLTLGNYDVTVTEANGCTSVCTINITEPAALTCSALTTNASCGQCIGTATVSSLGGTAPYTYLWYNGSTATTISGLCAGSYSVTVTDSKGCTSNCVAVVSGAGTMSCTTTKTNITCNNGSNGTATVIPTGGANYTYLWSNAATTSTITGLSSGTYTVTVTAGICTTSCKVVLSNPNLLTCSIFATNVACGCTGSATITPVGGVAPYTYLWNNGQTTKTRNGLCAGVYTATTTDSRGCTTTCEATISGGTGLSCSINGTNVSCNGGSNGIATVTAIGGSGYTYLWTNGSTNQTNTGLIAGTYTVTVTSSGGCTTTCSLTITQPTALSCNATSTNASCGVCNATANVTSNGGTLPYSYLWSNGATLTSLTALCSGTYTVTTTDGKGCTATCTTIVTAVGAISCTITGTNVSCNGGTNGSGTVNATGGSGYTYLWNNGVTTQTRTGLAAGTYTATVTSANGCTTTCSVTITQPAALTCSAASTTATCGVCNGTATVTAAGGTPTYTYLWSNAATTASISGLCGGTYTVTTTDSKGCTSTCTTLVGSTGSIACTIAGTNVSCNGGTNGSGTVNATGGSGYTYLWNNGVTTQTRTGLAAGTYTATVTSANGCTTTCSVTITQPAALTCSVSSTAATCGVCNGTATVTATGGTPTYTYLWSNAATTASISGLCGGTYTVTATDSRGCTTTCTTLVGSTGSIACTIAGTNVSCNGGTNGSGTVNATGGSGYTYLWNNGVTTQTRTGLAAGTYTATVTSANGCTTTCSVTITQPAALTCSVASTTATCGVCNGTATVTAAGGTPTYTYLWSNAATTSSISGLCGGTYTVTTTDSKGCTSTCTTLVGSTGSIACTITGTNVSCNGGSNGSGTVNATGGSGYTYLWNNGVTTQTRTGLAAGTYTATVTSANGCTTTCSVTITQPAALTCSVSSTAAACGVCNGTATVTATGGTPTYTYLWSNAATTASISGLCGGTYTVTTTDIRGCTTTCTTLIGSTGSIACTIARTNVSCNGGTNGSGTVNATGGSGYTYLWNNGVTTQTRTGLAAGTYTATVTSVNGCTTTCSVTITQPAALTTSTSTTPASCGICNGTATATPAGGTAPYTYSWNSIPVKTTATASGLCSGTFVVTVTDSKGCTRTAQAIVGSASSTVTCSITTNNNVSCFGANNGSLTALAAGGTSPYTYLWSNGKTTAINSGVTVGTYTVTITDVNGCTSSCTKVVTQPTQIVVVMSGKDASSCNNNDGTATASVSGGTPGYTYVWSNGGTNSTIIGLVAGTYTVTVTDSKGCTKTGSIVILQPAYVCTTFYTGHAQTYWNSNWKPDTLYKYLDANFNTVFPAGLKLQGTCGTAKSLLLTSAAAARITMQGTVNVAALTQSYVDPTLLALNNSLAAQLVTLALNIQFDLANPNFAPSTVNFKDLVVDSGPLTGLTVQQIFNEGVNALTGCGSAYSNSILRTYAAFINSSWYIGNKSNNVLTCPVNNCSKSSTWFSTDDELSFNAYPNPVLDELAISFISSKDTKFDVVIFDMTGRVVYRQESLATEGANTFRYNTSSFAQGIYTVQLRIDGLTRTVKIVKQ
nr:T9SS type A sorting domain-containing protein [Bacteroidota bacterium]